MIVTSKQVFKKKRIKAATCDLVNGHGKEEDSRPGTELAAALEWSHDLQNGYLGGRKMMKLSRKLYKLQLLNSRCRDK